MSVKRDSSDIRCNFSPAQCIAVHLRPLLVEQSGFSIPIKLLVDRVQCGEHADVLENSGTLRYATLGRIKNALGFSTVTISGDRNELENVNWMACAGSLVWKKEMRQTGQSLLMNIIRRKHDLDVWISSASLRELCENRQIINLICERNPEYFGLYRALANRLEEVDGNKIFDVLQSRSFKFIQKCFRKRIENARVSSDDLPIYNILGFLNENIVSESESVHCIFVKENVMRIEFPYVSMYVKEERKSSLSYMDCKVMVFYDELNKLLPSFVSFSGKYYKPCIMTYKVLVFDDISIKEAVGGLTLLEWLKEKVVDDLAMFAVSFCINSVARHICGISDRHPNNIKILPMQNAYVNIDNKYGFGISKPIGLDSSGTGIVGELYDFFGDDMMAEIKRTAAELLRYWRLCHKDDIISAGKTIFHDLAPASYLEIYFASKLADEQELIDSFLPSFQNAAKRFFQDLKSH